MRCSPYLSLLILTTFLLCACKKESAEGHAIVLVNDGLNDPSMWAYETLDSLGYVSTPSSTIIAGSALNISLFQGDDCSRGRAQRGVEDQRAAMETALANGEQLVFEMDGVSASYSGLGGATITFAFAHQRLSFHFPHGAEESTYRVLFDASTVREVLVDGASQADPYNYASIDSTSASEWYIQVTVDACGPDLYAAADLSIERIKLYQSLERE